MASITAANELPRGEEESNRYTIARFSTSTNEEVEGRSKTDDDYTIARFSTSTEGRNNSYRTSNAGESSSAKAVPPQPPPPPRRTRRRPVKGSSPTTESNQNAASSQVSLSPPAAQQDKVIIEPEQSNTKVKASSKESLQLETAPNNEKSIIEKPVTSDKAKVDVVTKNPFQLIKRFPNEFEQSVLSIGIHRTDPLVLDRTLMQPFVRIHLVDQITGQYVKKSQIDRSVTMKGEPSNLDYILPVITKPFILSNEEENAAFWEEEIVLNEKYLHLVKADTLLLFEVQSLTSLSGNIQDSGNTKNATLPIAWAFMKPISSLTGFCNTERVVRLQLYRVPVKKPAIDRLKSLFSKEAHQFKNAPEPFKYWKLGYRVEYPSSLYVTLKAKVIPNERNVLERPILPTDNEKGKLTFDQLMENYAIRASPVHFGDLQMMGGGGGHSYWEALGLNYQMPFRVEWSRIPGQVCRLPNQKSLVLDAGIQGGSAMKFSNNGYFLAVGTKSTQSLSSTYPILIYSCVGPMAGTKLASLEGSQGPIHDICWSRQDNLVLGAGADHLVRLWNVTSFIPVHLPILIFQVGASVNISLLHPHFDHYMFKGDDEEANNNNNNNNNSNSHNNNGLLFFTASTDGIIRLWTIRETDILKTRVILPDDQKKNPESATVVTVPLLSVMKPKVLVEPDKKMTGHESDVTCLLFDSFDGSSANHGKTFTDPGSLRLYSGDAQGIIKIWVPDENNSISASWICFKTISDPEIAGVPINVMRGFSSNRKLAIHGRDGVIRIFDLRMQRCVSQILIPRRGISSTMTSLASNSKTSGSAANAAANSLLLNRAIKGAGNSLPSLNCQCDVSPCGTFLISGSSDGRAYVWLLGTNTLVSIYDNLFFDGTLQRVAFHPHDNYVAFCSWNEESPPLLLFTFSNELPRQEAASSNLVDQLADTLEVAVNSPTSARASIANTPAPSLGGPPSPTLQSARASPVRSIAESSPTRMTAAFKSSTSTNLGKDRRYSLLEVLQLMQRTNPASPRLGTPQILEEEGTIATAVEFRNVTKPEFRPPSRRMLAKSATTTSGFLRTASKSQSTTNILLDPELYEIKFALNRLDRQLSMSSRGLLGVESPPPKLNRNSSKSTSSVRLDASSVRRSSLGASSSSYLQAKASSRSNSPLPPSAKGLERSLISLSSSNLLQNSSRLPIPPSSPTLTNMQLGDPLEEQKSNHQELRERLIQRQSQSTLLSSSRLQLASRASRLSLRPVKESKSTSNEELSNHNIFAGNRSASAEMTRSKTELFNNKSNKG